DYPVRFNDERTAIIKDDTAVSNVPFGMHPVVRLCHISPRVNGVDYPVRFNDERTAIIKDDTAVSNVPFGMHPVVR
ncbi:hypothetical protein, partial [Morganella morganii]|uniref:hypothetical protein n=1 Tax=Morganella morganii TaxID=582 RepID=UPI001144E7D3